VDLKPLVQFLLFGVGMLAMILTVGFLASIALTGEDARR
jgi:hypothetical protein